MSNFKNGIWLSKLLRHQAINWGYAMDSRGFVNVDEIIAKSTLTFEKIQQIVDADKKHRFQLEIINGKDYIRAVQGHSIKNIEPDLVLIADPNEIPIVVHGTTSEAYELIKTTGLKCMGRNYIHFAHGTLNDKTVISGMRKTANVMIYINVEKAMNAGIKFYLSRNGVILSAGIDGVIGTEFFSKVDFV